MTMTEGERSVINTIVDFRSVLSPSTTSSFRGVPDGMAQGGIVKKMAVGGLSASQRQKVQDTVNDNGADELSRRQAQAKLDDC